MKKKTSISPECFGKQEVKPTVQDFIKTLKDQGQLPRSAILKIIKEASSILKYQPNVLNIQSPVVIAGDIHGQFYDLLNIFQKFGAPPDQKYLFLGDYVDRGMFCIQVITLLLVMKVNFPKQIFLLRGNHQTRGVIMHFNFRQECIIKYDAFVLEQLVNLFSLLPLSCVVDKSLFAVHAGISPQLSSIADLQKINRFTQPNQKGLLCDILWSDPVDQWNKLWNYNQNRLCSYYYTPYHSKKFLDKENLNLIIRGHEVQMQGYRYQTSLNKAKNLTLTIFSAPNYCTTYKNQAAVLIVNKPSDMHIKTFKAVQSPIVLPQYQNCFEWMMPFITENINKIMIKLFDMKVKKCGRRNAIIHRQQHMEVLAKIEQLQQLVFLEKILAQSLVKKREQLKQINQKQNNSQAKIVLEQFEELKTGDCCQKNPVVVKPLIFGPKLQKFRNRKFDIDDEDDQNLAPDFYQDFYQTGNIGQNKSSKSQSNIVRILKNKSRAKRASDKPVNSINPLSIKQVKLRSPSKKKNMN